MKDILLVIAYLLIGFAIGFWFASRDVVSIKIEGKEKSTNEVMGQTTATQDSVITGSEMIKQIVETQEKQKEESKPAQNVITPKEKTEPKTEPKKSETDVKESFNPNALTVASFVQDWTDYDAYLSIKNNTDKKIIGFKATIIYKSMNGAVLDYEEINKNIEIAPQMAKSIKIRGYGHDMYYAYYKSQIRLPERKFQIEFKLKSYE